MILEIFCKCGEFLNTHKIEQTTVGLEPRIEIHVVPCDNCTPLRKEDEE